MAQAPIAVHSSSAEISNSEVVHPNTYHRVDQFDNPTHWLRPISPEYIRFFPSPIHLPFKMPINIPGSGTSLQRRPCPPKPPLAIALTPMAGELQYLRRAFHTYIPPSGFWTVSLFVTEVTPGTLLAISATFSICSASVTVPLSVTAPFLAVTPMLPPWISLCFAIAAYTARRSLVLPGIAGAAVPDATTAVLLGALVSDWADALRDAAASSAQRATLKIWVVMFFSYSCGCCFWVKRCNPVGYQAARVGQCGIGPIADTT
ncbi:membrane hypothetical protein [Paraburkholderia sacchari]